MYTYNAIHSHIMQNTWADKNLKGKNKNKLHL